MSRFHADDANPDYNKRGRSSNRKVARDWRWLIFLIERPLSNTPVGSLNVS